METPLLSVIIPCYNECASIRQIVQALRDGPVRSLEIIAVDDGSTDGTREILRDELAPSGVRVALHPFNQGKGAALRTGFTAAASTCDWALTIDADGQHQPKDGRALLEIAQQGRRVIVVGKRQGMQGENVPWTSRFGRKFSNFWVWTAGGPWITDSQSGFRLYPLPETLELEVRARRYQFEVEVLVQALCNGIPTVEVPVSVVYQAKGVRVSHFRPWIDFCRNASTFSRLICARLFRLIRGQ